MSCPVCGYDDTEKDHEIGRLQAALQSIVSAAEFPDEYTVSALAGMAERALEQQMREEK
jgi:hypothetical protein